jgi:hypothetical protein
VATLIRQLRTAESHVAAWRREEPGRQAAEEHLQTLVENSPASWCWIRRGG